MHTIYVQPLDLTQYMLCLAKVLTTNYKYQVGLRVSQLLYHGVLIYFSLHELALHNQRTFNKLNMLPYTKRLPYPDLSLA